MKTECMNCPVFQDLIVVTIPGLYRLETSHGKCEFVTFFELRTNKQVISDSMAQELWLKMAERILTSSLRAHGLWPYRASTGYFYVRRPLVAVQQGEKVFLIPKGNGDHICWLEENNCSK